MRQSEVAGPIRNSLFSCGLVAFTFANVAEAQQLVGHVYGAGGPIAKSTVTLWAAGEGAPTSLAETQTKDDDAFDLKFDTKKVAGDLWAVDAGKSQIIYFPKGDPAQARILCRTVDDKPTDGTCQVKGPFHVVLDQQNRILVSNANSNTLTRFPADDPSKAEQLKVGYSPHAMDIDSQGNVWVANTMGEPSFMEMVIWFGTRSSLGFEADCIRGTRAIRP